jgi:hypothetical protein
MITPAGGRKGYRITAALIRNSLTESGSRTQAATAGPDVNF